MKVGVTTKNTASMKIYGPVINYSTSKGVFKVKVFIDYENKFMKVYTSTNLKGDTYHDLPDAGLFPAIQNMSMRNKNASLRTSFSFDLPPFELDNETLCIKDL